MGSGEKELEEAFEYYQQMRKALTGLFHVLNMQCKDPEDIVYKAGIDNLKGLHDNLVKLLKNSYPPKDVRIKLKESEYEDYELRKILPF
ncbi:MAG: hypothetical protein ACOC44_10145 [Promethearchaeia archaeon]